MRGLAPVLLLIFACTDGDDPASKPSAPTYAGRASCARCHQEQQSLWHGSHHDRAMEEATEETVLGDFNDATFTYNGITSTFFRRDGKFMVRTDGPDGDLQEYEISYTIGFEPLQQYLVRFPSGRLQALTHLWDNRPAETGGQRWYPLYPDEKIDHKDPLHWTRRAFTWNFMCAECHSTNLKKGYDLTQNRYRTTWSEIDVSCEACHGPASSHVAWAEAGGKGKDRGLVHRLKDARVPEWNIDAETGVAVPSTPPRSAAEIRTCARCHSRRSVLDGEYTHGRPLTDTHLPATLQEPLYHADGQIRDEVYVHGSFLQSRMYHKGVTCTDCHDPHSLTLRGSGNLVCYRCHAPERFGTPDHHFHKKDSRGALCVECHMPSTTYMGIDARRDHSIRIPRPDLTRKIGVPNACARCHEDKSAEWADEELKKRFPESKYRGPHFGEVFAAAEREQPGTGTALLGLVKDRSRPAVVRATAIQLLQRFPGPSLQEGVEVGVGDPDPMIRRAALDGITAIEPGTGLPLAVQALRDKDLSVRLAAFQALIGSGVGGKEAARVREQYVASQMANADDPGTHINLGVLHSASEQLEEAEEAYRMALKIDPDFIPAYVNLVDLFRQQARDEESQPLLREALKRAPSNADAQHAYGLLLVRLGRHKQAIPARRILRRSG